MDYSEYIDSNTLVLIPVLWMIATALHQTPKIPSWIISYLIGILGIGLCYMRLSSMQGVTVQTFFTSFTQGILVTGSSMLGNHAITEMMKKMSSK